MAFSDTDGSDFVVGQVWGKFGAHKYLIAQVRRRMEFTETVAAVQELTAWVEERYPRHRGHAKLVEDKANGPAVLSTLRARVPGLLAVDPRGDKGARARAVAPDVEAGNVHLPGMANAEETGYDRLQTPDWVRGLVDECAALGWGGCGRRGGCSPPPPTTTRSTRSRRRSCVSRARAACGVRRRGTRGETVGSRMRREL
jgi:predicted phage terminase large subunit-like protein